MLLCAACGPHPVHSHVSKPKPAGDTCASHSQASVSADTTRSLERATSSLEYENIWRAAQPTSSTGSVSSTAVRTTIREHSAQIQACYEAALTNSSETGGRVVVRFVIDASGHVPSASIASSEVQSAELGCCVAKEVTEWTFPPPEPAGFVVVEYPFTVRLQMSTQL